MEMGLIANSSAILELHANECIWALAGVQQGLGACITSQIFNTANRFKALAALMKLRRVDEPLIDEINKIIADFRDPSEKRNRALHDPWVVNREGGTGRVEVTANHKLVFEVREIPIEELNRDRLEIENFTRRFLLFRNKIFAALPTLPPIPELRLQPIHFVDLAHERSQSSGEK